MWRKGEKGGTEKDLIHSIREKVRDEKKVRGMADVRHERETGKEKIGSIDGSEWSFSDTLWPIAF